MFIFVQEEFRRLYIQLELLKEKNVRIGNRHLVAKISAMQEAATKIHDTTSTETSTKCSTDITTESSASTQPCVTQSDSGGTKGTAIVVCETVASSSTGSNMSPSGGQQSVEQNWEWESKENNVASENSDGNHVNEAGKSHSYLIKSGHAKTHSIVINLDDKSRFTEEVTV